ncbi:hypothetical protein DL771_012454 [Monosporascus sp. 5C6A]|nr:hypothetical protein DL771_012454 [Monosporascus sp. 5C6A]
MQAETKMAAAQYAKAQEHTKKAAEHSKAAEASMAHARAAVESLLAADPGRPGAVAPSNPIELGKALSLDVIVEASGVAVSAYSIAFEDPARLGEPASHRQTPVLTA